MSGKTGGSPLALTELDLTELAAAFDDDHAPDVLAALRASLAGVRETRARIDAILADTAGVPLR